jgi:hypothetical protein
MSGNNANKSNKNKDQVDLGLNVEGDETNAPENQSAPQLNSQEDNALAKAEAEIEKLKAEKEEADKKAAEAEEAKKIAEAALVEAKDEAEEMPHNDSKFWWVTFAAKDNPSATDQVILGVNGEMLVIKRNVKVIVPSRYLKVADNAVAKQYRQLPGEERVVVGEVKTYPYTKLKPATEEEYQAMKAEGTKATKEAQSKKEK